MNKLAVSVIVPVYNVEKYLKECIDSILVQTFKDFELILVDDCSTDGSRNICRELRDKYPNVTLICNIENKGPSISRNNAIAIAKGKYITFIDSDDWVAPNYLYSMYAVAEKENADVVCMGYTDYATIDGVNYQFGNKLQLVHQISYLTNNKKQRMIAMTEYKLCANGCGKLYKRSLFTEYKLNFKNILSEDILFHIPLLYLSEKYVILPETTYYYRKRQESITNGASIEKSKKAIESIVVGLRYLDEYISVMPDIRDDKVLVSNIRRFFADALFKFLFLKVSSGLNVKDIIKESTEVFNEQTPEQAGILTILLEGYFINNIVRR